MIYNMKRSVEYHPMSKICKQTLQDNLSETRQSKSNKHMYKYKCASMLYACT